MILATTKTVPIVPYVVTKRWQNYHTLVQEVRQSNVTGSSKSKDEGSGIAWPLLSVILEEQKQRPSIPPMGIHGCQQVATIVPAPSQDVTPATVRRSTTVVAASKSSHWLAEYIIDSIYVIIICGLVAAATRKSHFRPNILQGLLRKKKLSGFQYY
jgi:hypothetical protein